MKILLLLLSLAVTLTLRAADGGAKTNALTVVLELNDGARIIGTPNITNLPARAAFGRIDVALALVQSVEFKNDHETVTLSMRNGDKMQVALNLGAVELQTVFGRVSVPFQLVKKILVRTTVHTGDGLVLHFSFDEATTELVKDQSGMGNHGKVRGARPVAEGKVGGGMGFGNGGFIQVPHSESLVSMQKTREFSCVLWIKPRVLARDFPMLVGKGGNHPPKAFGGYEFTLNGAGPNDLMFVSGGYYGYTRNPRGRWVNQHLQEWIHLAVVTSPERGSTKFYVNGETTADEADDATDIKCVNFDVPNDLFIGGPDPGHHPNRVGFDGVMDELMIFNRALTADEIRQLYQSGK